MFASPALQLPLEIIVGEGFSPSRDEQRAGINPAPTKPGTIAIVMKKVRCSVNSTRLIDELPSYWTRGGKRKSVMAKTR
jgi:hypothetical protein